MSDHVWVKAGDKVFDQGDPGDCMYVVTKGLVRIVRRTTRGDMTLAELGSGEFFGEMSLLDGMTRSASVVATNKTELFMIHRRDFLDLIQAYPQVAISLLGELAMRLRKADTQIKSLSLKDAAGRVANVLLMLADDIGMFRKGKVEVEDLPLQQDMANMAGTSRETVSRMIHKFVKEGHVHIKGNKLTINDYEGFRKRYV